MKRIEVYTCKQRNELLDTWENTVMISIDNKLLPLPEQTVPEFIYALQTINKHEVCGFRVGDYIIRVKYSDVSKLIHKLLRQCNLKMLHLYKVA